MRGAKRNRIDRRPRLALPPFLFFCRYYQLAYDTACINQYVLTLLSIPVILVAFSIGALRALLIFACDFTFSGVGQGITRYVWPAGNRR